MLTLLSSKTALGRAVSPLTAVFPCPSPHPRVEHPERGSSLHDSRRKSALIENPAGVTENSPGQVRVCERAVLGKRPMTSAADRDAARQRESVMRPIPSLNLCLPGSRNHSPNHRLSSQKTSLNKFQQVRHKAGTSLAQGQNKPKQTKTSLNKRFSKKLFFTANATDPKPTLTLMLSLNSFTINNVKSLAHFVKGCVKS